MLLLVKWVLLILVYLFRVCLIVNSLMLVKWVVCFLNMVGLCGWKLFFVMIFWVLGD